MPAMGLDRRWWVAIGMVVVVAIAVGLSQTVFRRSPQECRPVLDLLEFNRSQAALIAAKGGGEDASIPSAAEQTAYQAWVDGLAERAGRVTSSELAPRAVQVADLANQFVAKLPLLRDAAGARAPGAPAPPVAFETAALNDRITAELAELSKACPR